MPKKKPLVGDARSGLDALKNQLMQELHGASTPSYRDRFRELARQRVVTQGQDVKNSEPPPNR